MRVGLTVPFNGVPLRELGPLAARAEELGFESLWSAESIPTSTRSRRSPSPRPTPNASGS